MHSTEINRHIDELRRAARTGTPCEPGTLAAAVRSLEAARSFALSDERHDAEQRARQRAERRAAGRSPHLLTLTAADWVALDGPSGADDAAIDRLRRAELIQWDGHRWERSAAGRFRWAWKHLRLTDSQLRQLITVGQIDALTAVAEGRRRYDLRVVTASGLAARGLIRSTDGYLPYTGHAAITPLGRRVLARYQPAPAT